jgi:hypothetical protein
MKRFIFYLVSRQNPDVTTTAIGFGNDRLAAQAQVMNDYPSWNWEIRSCGEC